MAAIRRIAGEHGVGGVRVAADDAERALLWKGRKSAFGAIARIKPNYYLHDTVVPRHQLPAVLAKVYEITARYDLLVLNVFHAGDGNLHPCILFDERNPGETTRVLDAGEAIMRLCVDVGGSVTGEHGIGLEKRDFMRWIFSDADIETMWKLKGAFGADGETGSGQPQSTGSGQAFFNPCKAFPTSKGCGEVHSKAVHAYGADAYV